MNTNGDPTAPERASSAPSTAESRTSERQRRYWRRNLRYLVVLLVIWAAVSLGCGVLLAESLNRFRLPGTGFKLGFWFAQQGSIYTFVALIFIYVVLMNRLDAEFAAERHAAGERA